MGDIVIGVDGSEASHRALRWALEEAQLRDDSAVVIHAHKRTVVRNPYATVYPYVPAGNMQVETDYERRMQEEQDAYDRRHAESTIQQALDQVGWSIDGPDVRPLAMARDPAKTLVEMSEHAELLVVGSHGRGRFAGFLLGSVSQHCAHHAHCPVVIVR